MTVDDQQLRERAEAMRDQRIVKFEGQPEFAQGVLERLDRVEALTGQLDVALQSGRLLMQQRDEADQRVAALKTALCEALNELGVPTDDYPAPVGNAVRILSEALSPDVERD